MGEVGRHRRGEGETIRGGASSVQAGSVRFLWQSVATSNGLGLWLSSDCLGVLFTIDSQQPQAKWKENTHKFEERWRYTSFLFPAAWDRTLSDPTGRIRMQSYNAWASVVSGSTHNMEPARRAVQAAVGRHSSHCNGDANELAERAFNVWRIANTAHSWLGSVLQTQTQTQAPPSTDRRRITASGYSTAMPLRDNSSPLAMTLSCWGPT
eukprot:Gb_07023 [translate_table: standard]